MASLLIVSGPCEGQFHRLGDRATVVGRDEGCVLQIADELVSRRHLEIRYDATLPGYALRDLGSANGTRLNDRPLEGPATLADGDLISIGRSELLFWARNVGDAGQALARHRQRGERGKRTIISNK